jgi:hydrogenase maturation protein HypF
MSRLSGARISVKGVVQGVGFRPFVYNLAQRLALGGWVRNTSAGVDIEVDGTPATVTTFIEALQSEAPPLARIDALRWEVRAPNGFTSFDILDSEPIPDAFQPIAPDVGLCADCLRELFDPGDRRYRYPFINCTSCGPRFTIIQDIPYDRPNTTMAPFAMCPACAVEYANPRDRRFHAQPIACPKCGPQIWLLVIGNYQLPITNPKDEAALQATRQLLRQGAIVAIKGLGGFHLACDATNARAVAELRRRKRRVDKPFALMLPGLAAIEAECVVSEAERALLESRERPIVILRRRPGSTIAAEVAPGQDTLGVMLPYTPLHYLLLEPAADFPRALVMTSGNVSEEPIAIDNAEARERLAPLVDAFLMHNRAIRTRCDDSVVRVDSRQWTVDSEQFTHNCSLSTVHYPLITAFLRRSRGYAPFPVPLPFVAPPLLAAGAELKNTFCLARERYAFLSHHIGDLENYETLCSFEDGVAHFERLFRVCPEVIAYDQHPNYLATRYALERAERDGLPAFGIQHHHAHVAACMADNGLTGERPVIGVAFDGTGYGDDGAIWGGEFLIATYAHYRRAFHIAYLPLPGGDAAVREPWRLALAWLDRAGIEWADDLPPVRYASHDTHQAALDVLRHQLRTGLNSPPTSSLGRLFDAISALAGVRQKVNYEAQAAIELEALTSPQEIGAYAFEVGEQVIDPAPVIRAVVDDLRAGVPASIIAARFHNGVAAMVLCVCRLIRSRERFTEVALSGGVWQNMTLLARTVELLERDGFIVYVHHNVPANDGGLALGQAAIAARIHPYGSRITD